MKSLNVSLKFNIFAILFALVYGAPHFSSASIPEHSSPGHCESTHQQGDSDRIPDNKPGCPEQCIPQCQLPVTPQANSSLLGEEITGTFTSRPEPFLVSRETGPPLRPPAS